MNKPRRLIAWFTTHQAAVLCGLAFIGLAAWGFVELADEVIDGDTRHFDEWAVRSLRNPADLSDPIGSRFFEEAGRDVTALGGVTVMTLVVGGVSTYLLLVRKFGTMWLLLATTFGAFVLSLLLKNIVDRPRPELVPHLSIVHTSSFPSGHSMNAAAVYLTLGFVLARMAKHTKLKLFFMIIAVAITILVGLSRIYMGVHYPTDVLAGWAGGAAWATLCVMLTSYLKHRGTIEQNIEDPEPPVASSSSFKQK